MKARCYAEQLECFWKSGRKMQKLHRAFFQHMIAVFYLQNTSISARTAYKYPHLFPASSVHRVVLHMYVY